MGLKSVLFDPKKAKQRLSHVLVVMGLVAFAVIASLVPTGDTEARPASNATLDQKVDAATSVNLGPGRRFNARVDFVDSLGRVRQGQVVNGTPSGDSGLFWFFQEDNWEMLVKVLNGCSLNNHVWVYVAATTDVQYRLTVRDTFTNQVSVYNNPPGTRADAITDIEAFSVCGSLATDEPDLESFDVVGGNQLDLLDDPFKSRVEGAFAERSPGKVLFLQKLRFQLDVGWQSRKGQRGQASVVPFGNDESGLFYFFSPGNWDLLVKVLDGCRINNHYWLFAAAATDVKFDIDIRDRQSAGIRRYAKNNFEAAPAIIDIRSMPCATSGTTTTSTPTSTTTSVPNTTTTTSVAGTTTTTSVGTTSTTSVGTTSTTSVGTTSTTSIGTTSTTSIATSTTTSVPTTSTTTSVQSVSWANDVVPLFTTSGCTACHTSSHHCDGSATGDGLDLSSGSASQKRTRVVFPSTSTVDCEYDSHGNSYVNTGNPASSLLLRKATGSLPHTGGSPWTAKTCTTPDTAYCTFFIWVDNGAPNN